MTIEAIDLFKWAIVIALIPLGYYALRAISLLVTQRFRLQLAREAETYLSRDDLTEDQRKAAERWLDNAFRGGLAWVSAFLLPAIIYALLFMTRGKLAKHANRSKPETFKEAFQGLDQSSRLTGLAMLSSAGAAPFSVIVFVILMFPAYIWAWLSRSMDLLSPQRWPNEIQKFT